MTVKIKIVGTSSQLWPHPKWLKSFVDTRDGQGKLVLTDFEEAAKPFVDASDALQFYKQQSWYVPKRPDGKPNRPLTAYTVEIGK